MQNLHPHEEQQLNEYKGIYYNAPKENKYIDPNTGAHFEVNELCRRLADLQKTMYPHIQLRNNTIGRQSKSEKSNQPIKINVVRNPNALNMHVVKGPTNKSSQRAARRFVPEKQVINSTTYLSNESTAANPSISTQDIKESLHKLYLNKARINHSRRIEEKANVIIGQNDFNFQSLDLRKNALEMPCILVKKEDSMPSIFTIKGRVSRNRKNNMYGVIQHCQKKPCTINV
jgi:hypothetical protein